MSATRHRPPCHVAFRFSPIYDLQCRTCFDLRPTHERPYPDAKTITDFMKRLKREWEKNDVTVLNAIQRYTRNKWTTKEHLCYVVGSGDPFSDPLTMPVFSPLAPIEYASDVLCHELIHRNLLEPAFAKKWNRIFANLKKRYPKDTKNTLVHIIVHAVHEQIFLNIFSEERLKRDKRIMAAHPDYHRAWQIVEEEGAAKITKRYFG